MANQESSSVSAVPGPATSVAEVPDSVLKYIEAALRGLHYGQLTIIVHDGSVVQIERTERQRFSSSRRRA